MFRTFTRSLIPFVAGGIVGLGAVVGTVALAHGPPGFGGPGFRGADSVEEVKEHQARFAEHLFEELDTTPEQQKAILSILDERAEEGFAYREEGKALRKEFKKAMDTDTVDRRQVEQLRKRMVDLVDRSSADRIDMMLDLREVLTAEQRAEMKELREERRDEMHDRVRDFRRGERGREREHGGRDGFGGPDPFGF